MSTLTFQATEIRPRSSTLSTANCTGPPTSSISNFTATAPRPCPARHWPRHRTRVPGHHQRCRGSRPHHGAAGEPRPSRGHHHPRPPRRRQAIRTRRVRGLAHHQAGRHPETRRQGRHGGGRPRWAHHRGRGRRGDPSGTTAAGQRDGRQGPVATHAPAADAERRRNGGPHLLNAKRTPRSSISFVHSKLMRSILAKSERKDLGSSAGPACILPYRGTDWQHVGFSRQDKMALVPTVGLV